jgi:hypothetical protein
MWSESRWYTSHRYFREDEKIRVLAPATLTVVTITAALSGFVLQQNAFQKILSSKLQSVLHDRSVLLNAAVAQRTQTTFTADRFARLDGPARQVLLEPNFASTAKRHQCRDDRREFARHRCAERQRRGGEVARRFGNAGATPGVAAALGNGLELAWDGELILRARSPLVSNRKRIGFIVMDQSPGSLETELFGVHPTKQRDSQLPWKPSPPIVRSRPVRRRQPAVADSAGDVRSGRRCRRS